MTELGSSKIKGFRMKEEELKILPGMSNSNKMKDISIEDSLNSN